MRIVAVAIKVTHTPGTSIDSVVAEVASSRQSGLDCSWCVKVSARWIVMSSYT